MSIIRDDNFYRRIGYLIPIVSFGGIFLAILVSPWFSWTKNALSDLGAHAGSDIIFNSSLIISGILFLTYSIHIYIKHENTIAYVGAFFISLSAVFLTLIGVFPETYGDIHYTVSVGFFVTLPIGILLYSGYLALETKDKKLFLFGVLVFLLSIIIWSYPWKKAGITGVAIPEFLSALVAVLWLIYYNYLVFGWQ